MRRQRLAGQPYEHELHLVADQRLDAGVGQARLYPAERPARTVRIRRSVLMEERSWGPGQSIAENPQPIQVDTDPLIPHHPGRFAEHNPGLVDGEYVPDRAGAEPRIGERAHPP